ncbi:DUF1289 domain-containing protein [Candidatus Puniceispirillum sp.]|uniref:DUF1289 domain-containing protein n=1 Tax=Candidatus Puniceispirillum sp. TaxID=2026719 RepID=UPI003F699DC5
MKSKLSNAAVAMPSPCISICQMDPQADICLGCYRTRQEIASWSRMDAEAQRDLLDTLNERRAEKTGIRRRPTRRRTIAGEG